MNSHNKQTYKNIAVLGAGWAGCHVALFLKNKGYNISILEQSSKIFSGASGNNQFRSHYGYHYPRSMKTIEMIRKNLIRFEEDYGFCLKDIHHNYYAIAEENSILDHGIYEKIFPEIEACDETIIKLNNLSKVYKTNEKVIVNDFIIDFFLEKLSQNINFNSTICHANNYNLIIDCTNNSYRRIPVTSKQYILIVLKPNKQDHIDKLFALTIMDGEFCSIYPLCTKEKTLYSLSHVKYSDLDIQLSHQDRIKLMIKSVSDFYPSFADDFEVIDTFVGTKNINTNYKDASRLLEYNSDGKYISFCINKILSIYEMQDVLEKLL